MITGLQRGNSEIDVEVFYTYYPGGRGQRDRLAGKAGAGPALEPDEEPSFEIHDVVDLWTGLPLDLTPLEYESLLRKLREYEAAIEAEVERNDE